MDRQQLVLFADGDQALRASVKFLLELEGLAVKLCADGGEIVAHPALFQAACIVFDHQMSGGDGLAVAGALKTLGITAPMVMTTDALTRRLRRAAAEAGLHAVLEKPLLDDELIDAVRNAIGSGRGHP